jgi:hypothetical protein
MTGRAPGPITLSEKLRQMLRVPLLLQSFYESFCGAYEANFSEIFLRSSNSVILFWQYSPEQHITVLSL